MVDPHTSVQARRFTLVLALLALLLVTSLGLGYLYMDTNRRLSDSETVSNNQITRINELEFMLSASREAWEIVNITKSFGGGLERVGVDPVVTKIALVAIYHSQGPTIYENGTLGSINDHYPEYAYVYSPRANMTLRINAVLRESTRNIPIGVFKVTDDLAGHTTSTLARFEAKSDVYNEFSVVLPVKGWYYVISREGFLLTDPKLDYNIRVEMRLYDGISFIPFVIRTWDFY
jgi:hypothetical protein